MRGRFDMTYIRLAKFLNLLQHIVQLLLKGVLFVFSEIDSSQSGDVPNVQLRSPGHGPCLRVQIANQPDDCDGKRHHKKEKNNLAFSSLFAHRTRTP